ncbi:hypothetical protein [Clostridium perfringens]
MNEFFKTKNGQQLLRDINSIAHSLEVIANTLNSEKQTKNEKNEK